MPTPTAPRILVTGATGTVGRAVLRHLLPHHAAGLISIIGTARSDASATSLRADGIPCTILDFDRPETLRPALRGVGSVFLATGYSVDMLVHSKRLLDAARAEGVGHVVHLGALAPDESPHAHFAWHRMVEICIEAMGFGFTHLRPNFFIDTVWKGFRQRPDRLVHFIADRRVSWVAADDIGAVAATALCAPEDHAGRIYPLANEALSFPDLAGLLSSITRAPVSYRPRPAADLPAILARQGMDRAYAAGLSAAVAATEAGQEPKADAVFDTVRMVTGRAPILWRDFAAAHLDELSVRTT